MSEKLSLRVICGQVGVYQDPGPPRPVCLLREEDACRMLLSHAGLVAACRAVLDGFRYEHGRPVMAEWKMKEILTATLAAAQPPEDTL